MNESKISVRYAKALFGLVKEDQSFDVQKKDIELLYQCIRESPELQFVIQSPVIRAVDKIRLFEESFAGALSPLTFNFVRLVLNHRREEYLSGICHYFLGLLNTERGVKPAELVTAAPLDEKLRQSVIRLIARKFDTKVELREEINQAIIGGFVLRVGDQQIDASISSKLGRIKNELINSPS
jgi:F-type H+-transporting ATPase subunit delta